MSVKAKLPRLLLSSPWFLLVFLVVPALVILCLKLNVAVPLLDARLLLVNNVCFAVLVACRLGWYLARSARRIRYDAALGRPQEMDEVSLSCAEARQRLAGGGYALTADGNYGEKRDLGYLGTILLYGGLLLLLATGTWDNLRQYSGVLLDGVGPATRLNDARSYRKLTLGPLASLPENLPQMRILSQILPDSTYRMGATQIALSQELGDPVTTVLVPGQPFRYHGCDIYMSKLVFEPQLVIKDRKGRTLFDSFVKLDPLVQKRGDFSFYGLFMGGEVVGGAYYQPEKSLMMLVVTRNGKKEVADMQFQVDQQVATGDYLLSCAKMGQWSEIHVVRSRHKELLWLGGVIALAGLVLRLAIRPQRVWLEEHAGGCRLLAVGAAAKQLLQAE